MRPKPWTHTYTNQTKNYISPGNASNPNNHTEPQIPNPKKPLPQQNPPWKPNYTISSPKANWRTKWSLYKLIPKFLMCSATPLKAES